LVVAWHGYDTSSTGVLAQRYDSGGTPLGSEFQVNTYTLGSQFAAAVAADAAGNFVVVWMDSQNQDGATFGVFAQRFDSGGTPQGAEFQVNTYTTAGQRSPAVAADATGNFVVVWTDDGQDGSAYGVFGQRYASDGTPQGAEFQVNTYTTGFQGQPAIAGDGLGNFLVVWVSNHDGHQAGVFGQRYDSGGTPQGAEFQVNTYTTGSQWTPAVAADGQGKAVVVWRSEGQDGQVSGIFGQRLCTITTCTNGDDCCPVGCDESNDDDCPPPTTTPSPPSSSST